VNNTVMNNIVKYTPPMRTERLFLSQTRQGRPGGGCG
jgi:hypothetical protein